MSHSPTRAPNGTRRALLQLACALLLFAQHMGLAHAIWHAAQQRPVHEQRYSAAADRDHDSPVSRDVSSLCVLDAVLGQVLGGAALGCPAFSAEKPLAQAPAGAPVAYATSDALTPRSRGPPSLP